MSTSGKSTRAIHGRRDDSFRAAVYPIYHSVTYAVEKNDDYGRFYGGEEDMYIYTRLGNPTVRNVEEKLAALENAEDGLLFASGMAAITSSILAFVRGGDVIAAQRRLYGTAYTFLRDIAPRFGIQTRFLDDEDLYRLDELVPDAKLVYFETPINPTCDCIDIAQVVKAARRLGAVSIIDNTFASPINQNPIDLGVDVVVHSATKYINGHSDVVAGAALSSENHIHSIRGMMKIFGGCMNPHDAATLDRSLKTLSIRMEAHNRNALALAQFFEADRRVKRVYYPGLSSSPAYPVAARQMRGFGGMLSIDLGGLDAAKRFADSVQVGLNATSLGGVETLVSLPMLSSHVNMSEDELRAAGVTPGMVRISAGLEDLADLTADFEQALIQAGG